MNQDKVYYPGLNGIRAIAALIVLIFHIDLTAKSFGIDDIGFHKTGMAGYGVVLFFVLSGFLITSLLLKEKLVTQQIKIKDFYIRRILRIWPIYYLAIFITIFVLLTTSGNNFNHDSIKSLFLYVFFMPNVAFELKIAIIMIAPLWSVGVEEQFYALWPWIIKKIKNIFIGLVFVIIGYLLIKLFARLYFTGFLYNLIYISAIDCMAIGGLGAYLLSTRKKLINYIYNPVLQIVSWVVLIVSCLYKPLHLVAFFDQEINAIFYIIIILNVSSNPKSLISLENKFFDFIGRISYGIYVYHFIVITFLSKILIDKLGKGYIAYFLMLIIVVSATISVASISYIYFEKRFLKLRRKFSVVQSINSRQEILET